MAKAKPQGEKGFSLIETMIAMLFLAVSLLALGQLVAVAVNQNAMSRSTSVGISAAMGKLEQLRGEYNNQLKLGSVTLSSSTSPETIGNFNLTWTVSNGAGANQKVVTVTATPRAGEYLNSRRVEIMSNFAP